MFMRSNHVAVMLIAQKKCLEELADMAGHTFASEGYNEITKLCGRPLMSFNEGHLHSLFLHFKR